MLVCDVFWIFLDLFMYGGGRDGGLHRPKPVGTKDEVLPEDLLLGCS